MKDLFKSLGLLHPIVIECLLCAIDRYQKMRQPQLCSLVGKASKHKINTYTNQLISGRISTVGKKTTTMTTK